MYCDLCSGLVHNSKLFAKHDLQNCGSLQDLAFSIIQKFTRTKSTAEVRTALESFRDTGRTLTQKLQTQLYQMEGNSIEQVITRLLFLIFR